MKDGEQGGGQGRNKLQVQQQALASRCPSMVQGRTPTWNGGLKVSREYVPNPQDPADITVLPPLFNMKHGEN